MIHAANISTIANSITIPELSMPVFSEGMSVVTEPPPLTREQGKTKPHREKFCTPVSRTTQPRNQATNSSFNNRLANLIDVTLLTSLRFRLLARRESTDNSTNG